MFQQEAWIGTKFKIRSTVVLQLLPCTTIPLKATLTSILEEEVVVKKTQMKARLSSPQPFFTLILMAYSHKIYVYLGLQVHLIGIQTTKKIMQKLTTWSWVRAVL